MRKFAEQTSWKSERFRTDDRSNFHLFPPPRTYQQKNTRRQDEYFLLVYVDQSFNQLNQFVYELKQFANILKVAYWAQKVPQTTP